MSDLGTTQELPQEVDVVIVGAGISGINAAYRLQTESPHLSYVILERRDSMGGTWDLFKYPGLRSDSDMFTLGFPFEPWTGDKAIADGDEILEYVRQTAEKHGIAERIRYGVKVTHSSWSTPDARWTVRVDTADGPREVRTRFVYAASGYYSYDQGYTPDFPGREDFRGEVIHPQFWPEGFDHTGKKVVVIGSGATAVTLVPALAQSGVGHVTMLQRTPTYIIALPGKDPVANFMRDKLRSSQRAYSFTRWRAILQSLGFYQFTRAMPKSATRMLTSGPKMALRGSQKYDPKHFTPPYKPWDQRLCVVPDGDLFTALKTDRADIVTDTIDRFVPEGILLSSGEVLEADVIVTATGLQMQILGGSQLEIDGEPVQQSRHFVYRGCMIEGVPNAAVAIGYTNASWTLRSDLSAQFFCRVVNHVTRGGYEYVYPKVGEGEQLTTLPVLDLAAGYVQRSVSELPKRGDRKPWTVRQNYVLDSLEMRRASVTEDLVYVRAGEDDQPGQGTAEAVA